MPTYEYQCQACGKHVEEFQRLGEPPLKKCPSCGKNKLQKQVSASAFQLKGSGWYATDFRDKTKKADVKEADKSTEKNASDGKTETTPKTDANKDKTSPDATKKSEESTK